MAVILLANELGAGTGHAVTLLALAKALAERGHRPILAMREVAVAAKLADAAGFEIVQAPYWAAPAPAAAAEGRFKARTYADILLRMGFGDAAALTAMCRAWDGLLAGLKPALAIADYSPGLHIAAAGALPIVAVGSGFWLPPAGDAEFPPLRTDVAPQAPQSVLLGSVAEARRRLGRQAPGAVTAILSAEGRYIHGLPELDPYASFRRGQERVVGPLHPLPPPLPMPTEAGFFAYFNTPTRAAAEAVAALGGAGMPGAVHIHGAPPGFLKQVPAGLEVLGQRPPIAGALAGVKAIVHFGGAGTVESAMAAGRVQIVIPQHLEQSLNARVVQRAGIGLTIGAGRPLPELGAALRQLVGDSTALARAGALALDIAGRGYGRAVASIIEGCEALLGG